MTVFLHTHQFLAFLTGQLELRRYKRMKRNEACGSAWQPMKNRFKNQVLTDILTDATVFRHTHQFLTYLARRLESRRYKQTKKGEVYMAGCIWTDNAEQRYFTPHVGFWHIWHND